MYSQNQNNFPVYPPPAETSSAPPVVADNPPVSNENEVIGAIPDTAFVDEPVFIVCPVCNYRGNTQVERVRGCTAFWGLCCCCFSLCSQMCHDYQHSCPQCKTIFGTYQVI